MIREIYGFGSAASRGATLFSTSGQKWEFFRTLHNLTLKMTLCFIGASGRQLQRRLLICRNVLISRAGAGVKKLMVFAPVWPRKKEEKFFPAVGRRAAKV